MSTILLISIAIRLVAFGFSAILLRRLRDWRMAFLSIMLLLMALRQTLTLMTQSQSWSLSFPGQTTELPGLAVSVMALLAVVFLDRMLRQHRDSELALAENESRYRFLAENTVDPAFVPGSAVGYQGPVFPDDAIVPPGWMVRKRGK